MAVGGQVTALVACLHRRGKVSALCYLVDVYCLGVKDPIGPASWGEAEFGGQPAADPLDVARVACRPAAMWVRVLGRAAAARRTVS
jgi:hypothetical protein